MSSALAAPVEQTTGKKVADADEAMRLCAMVETELAELRAAYDQYFLGVERKPPTKRHDALKKEMRELKSHFVRQTSVRFRIDNLAQKLTTFERLWDRTLKEIEAGTYKRHLFKAKMHASARTQPSSAVAVAKKGDDVEHFDVDEDLDISDLGPEAPTNPDLASALAAAASRPVAAPAVRAVPATVPATMAAVKTSVAVTAPAKPTAMAAAAAAPMPMAPPFPSARTSAIQPAHVPAPAPRPATVAAAPAGPAGGLSDQKIKAIYDAYVMAKKRCGEDTSKLSLNAVADTLKKQVPALMKQHQAKSVEFKVVIKDGKAVLRALPKE